MTEAERRVVERYNLFFEHTAEETAAALLVLATTIAESNAAVATTAKVQGGNGAKRKPAATNARPTGNRK